jgi:hypothetical protein
MTKDDLIRMADLVGYDVDDDDDVYAPASGRYGLDPRLEHFAQLVAEHTLQYKCRNVSTKLQNSDTSAERVHENDKSIHEPWNSSDMAHRSGGLSVEQAEKQKPVAYYWRDTKACYWIADIPLEDLANLDVSPLYTAPPKRPVKSYTGGYPQYATDIPKREWVGLSDVEVAAYSDMFNGIRLVKGIEALLKERNNG